MTDRKVLEMTSVEQLMLLNPTKEQEQSFDIVRCLNTVWRASPEQIGWLLYKLAFLCKDELILDLSIARAYPHEFFSYGPKTIMIGGVPSMTPLRTERVLNNLAFTIESATRVHDSKTRSIIVAKRMPKVMWDGVCQPHDYDEHTVVTLPLTFPRFKDKFFPRMVKEGGYTETRVKELIQDFTIWKFVPNWWCKSCKHMHQGTHRLVVAKRLDFKTIDMRIMRCWWYKTEPDLSVYQCFDWSKEK